MIRSSIFTVLLLLSFTVFAQQNSLLNEKNCRDHVQTQEKIGFSGYKQSSLLNDYDVHFYFLDIALERTSTYISGNVQINSEVVSSILDTFALELIDELTVDSVFINGAAQTFQHLNDHIYIPLSVPASIGTPLITKVYYHGNPTSGGGFFSGITNDVSPSWGNQVTWTLSEPFNANQWWPCKQILTDKADSSWVFITTANTNKAGSNGMLTASVPVAGSKMRYEWKSRNPMAYYLISASVAEYVEYNIWAHPAGTSDSLLIQNYVYDNPATLPNFQSEIDLTPGFVELYSDLFGLYPFMNEKYGHCMAPMGGGMEHQTMTTLGFFNFYLICHELAHMWFGDNVTCATWSDIWINEGFASYGEYLAAQYLDSYTEAQSHMLDVHNNVKSESGGSIYIPVAQTNDENRIFDGRLSYDKGSAIIHMIRFEMQNDSLFFETLKKFQDDFGDSTATGEDFKHTAEIVSGLSFTDFFDQWYYGEGYPTFHLTWYQASDTLYFTSTQTTSTGVTPLFKMLMELQITSASGDTTVLWYQDASTTTFKIPYAPFVVDLEVDPNNWVVDGNATISASIGEISNPVYYTLAPNPCIDQLRISFLNTPDNNSNVQIIDITGRCVFDLPAQQTMDVNVANLKPGVYMVSCQSQKGSLVQRFIKL